jgi:hypothetical protein
MKLRIVRAVAGLLSLALSLAQLALAQTTATTTSAPAACNGTGTTNYVPLWTSTTNLGNSLIYQAGTQVGIGTTTPGAKLGVKGRGIFSTDSGTGLLASTTSSTGYGVEGEVTATTGYTAGVFGTTTSTEGFGVLGTVPSSGTGAGVFGSGGIGVLGVSTASGGSGGRFIGYSTESGPGSDAVVAYGGPDINDPSGVGGSGIVAGGGYGRGGDGVGGVFTGGDDSSQGDGVDGFAGSGYAGYFYGDVQVAGTLTAVVKDFKIDHPLDAANRYLVHASVESSEMMNLYTGTIITDGQGHAVVQLPEWFEALNADFRYQLTVIGQFAQAIVGRKMENNRFEIRTSAPNVEVSWQVTGVRQDAYAKANPLVVEQEKEARLRGFYIHPELYGAPAEKQIEWVRHPETMKRIQEMRAQQLAAAQKQAVLQPLRPATRGAGVVEVPCGAAGDASAQGIVRCAQMTRLGTNGD